ncbi:MAG TPA: ABC transporter ATP-binding protein [Mycobacteriales bacterium]|nr:ABC transporter ATP-binding protein [Mycobacteriales bacterium]
MSEPTLNGAGPLLETRRLTRHFQIGGALSRRTLHAVDDVDLSIGRREIVALVGESGSGKSTVARLLAMVYRPTSGDILFEGRSIATLNGRSDVLGYRRAVPMVFQDPFSSLNPAYPVSHGLLRTLALHRPDLHRSDRRSVAAGVLDQVGLVPGEAMLDRFPHELSGGQRQRVGFAQALAMRPKLIVADEPVSMLDVSIRIGLLNLMAKLRAEADVSFLYITHDIASARYLSDRIAVMYAGHIVEVGPTEQVLADPRHPYTQLLLDAVPDPRAPLGIHSSDIGEPPRVVDPEPGCRFRWRCPLAIDDCARIDPEPAEVRTGQHVACIVAQRAVAEGERAST